MNVLVTGGAGYIGSHTCKLLKAQKFNPVVYDNFSTGHKWAVKWGPFVEGDVRNHAILCRAIQAYKIEAVIHFAALAYVGESVREPLNYYDNNAYGMIQLLKAMKDCRVRDLVFSSSCATYGIPESVPIQEKAKQNPINPYGRTKLICEQMAQDFHSAYGIRTIALRYFNAAGGDSELEIGESHDPETHLIPLAIRAAHTGQPLVIYGRDYPTGDGTCIRDYIHVTDLARAHLAAIQKLRLGDTQFEFMNLGTGNGFSVLEIAKMVEASTGKALKLEFAARRPGDPPELVADPTLANQSLNWHCSHSDLKNIIDTANRFFLHSNPPVGGLK